MRVAWQTTTSRSSRCEPSTSTRRQRPTPDGGGALRRPGAVPRGGRSVSWPGAAAACSVIRRMASRASRCCRSGSSVWYDVSTCAASRADGAPVSASTEKASWVASRKVRLMSWVWCRLSVFSVTRAGVPGAPVVSPTSRCDWSSPRAVLDDRHGRHLDPDLVAAAVLVLPHQLVAVPLAVGAPGGARHRRQRGRSDPGAPERRRSCPGTSCRASSVSPVVERSRWVGQLKHALGRPYVVNPPGPPRSRIFAKSRPNSGLPMLHRHQIVADEGNVRLTSRAPRPVASCRARARPVPCVPPRYGVPAPSAGRRCPTPREVRHRRQVVVGPSSCRRMSRAPQDVVMTSGLLVLAGLFLAVVGLVGLVRGRLGRGLRNRTTSALVAAVGLVVALAAGAVSPAVSDTLAAPKGPTSRGTPVGRPRSAAPARRSGPRRRSSTPTPRPRATPSRATTSPTCDAGTSRTVGPAGDRAGRARRPARQGQGAADRLRPWAVRAGVGGHRPQRLRHPQRHPAPRPDRARAPAPAPTAASSSAAGWTTPTPGSRSRSCAGRPRRRACRSTTWWRSPTRGRRAPSSGRTSTRTRFANDPLNLLAVDGPTNQAKSDGDAATWLPPRTSYRCAYVARQTAVKARYRLWVTAAERDAVRRVLASCAAQRLPVVAADGAPGRWPFGLGRSPGR